MSATTVKLPSIFSAIEPSGNTRVGFRVPGSRRKVQRTFRYAHEGEAWAEEARRRVLGALLADDDDGVEAVIAEVLGRTLPANSAPSFTAPEAAAPVSPVLAAYARTWLDARRGSGELATHRWYTTHVEAVLAEPGDNVYAPLSDRPIAEITRTEIEAWRTRELDRGVGRPSLNARLKVLGMVLRFALSDRLIPSDPTAEVRALKVDTKPKGILDGAGERRLMAELADDDRGRLFVLLGLYLGLRFEEVSALEPTALIRTDDGRAYLSIHQVKERRGAIRPRTKSGKSRLVPIGGDLLDLWAEVALVTEPGALMFRWKYDAYRHSTWKGLTDRAGLNRQKSTAKGREAVRFGFHQLRHTCGSRMAAAGRPRSEIALFLGHADESTTAGYIHASIDGDRHDATIAALKMTDLGRSA